MEHARTTAGDRWPSAEDAFAEGLRIRREMFGDDTTDGQVGGASGFAWPLQDTVTRWCFGEVWSREELDRPTRSMLTIGLLVALGQPAQVRVHVRGAIENGVTVDQIREVLLHSMVYAGVPRAVDGFQAARETLVELGYEV